MKLLVVSDHKRTKTIAVIATPYNGHFDPDNRINVDQIGVWLGLFGCLSGKEGGSLPCHVSSRNSRMRPLWEINPRRDVIRMGRSTTLSADTTLETAQLWK